MRTSSGRLIRVTRGIQPGFPLALLLALAVGGCTGSGHEARAELQRLDEAMQQHAEQYGRFPATLDPDRPASPANLPFTPAADVQLRFLGVTDNGYGATARRGIWICSLVGSSGGGGAVNCTPTGPGSSEATEESGAPSDSPLDDLLTPADTAAAAAPPVDPAGFPAPGSGRDG